MLGYISDRAANACIYVTYIVFLIFGLTVAYKMRHRKDFLASLRTQSGIPLAFNFIASAMGSGILLTYPQIGVVSGVQGVLVYSLTSSLPMLVFAFFGPKIRKKCPEGFVLTGWVFERYGYFAGLYLGIFTIITMYLYMVSELSCIQMIVNLLTNQNGLPAVIVECVVTTIYTSWGGFPVSMFTDNVQGIMMTLLLIIVSCAMGAQIDIDRSMIGPSGLLKANLIGWQLVYIFPVAITSNDFFLSGFWLRTFASKNNKQLLIACGLATFILFVYLTLCGFTGIIAVWAKVYDPNDPDQDSSLCFFYLIQNLPGWVIGFVLVFVVALSTAVMDSLQSAMVTSLSNDIFRNRLRPFYVRLLVLLCMFPVVVVALKSPNILQIFLISDLVSAAVIPTLMLGLFDCFYFLNQWDIIGGGLGGMFTVWVFGTCYYDDPQQGGYLMIIEQGLYTGSDWGPFGAFVAAPVGSVIFCTIFVVGRLICQFTYSKIKHTPFTALDKPVDATKIDYSAHESPDQLTRLSRTYSIGQASSYLARGIPQEIDEQDSSKEPDVESTAKVSSSAEDTGVPDERLPHIDRHHFWKSVKNVLIEPKKPDEPNTPLTLAKRIFVVPKDQKLIV